jgi:hypothetical protein
MTSHNTDPLSSGDDEKSLRAIMFADADVLRRRDEREAEPRLSDEGRAAIVAARARQKKTHQRNVAVALSRLRTRRAQS